jgi:hypothetical protein
MLPLPASNLTRGKITVTAARETRRFGFMVVTLALAGAALGEDAPLPRPLEQVARGYITRAALEAPIRFLSSDLGDEFEAARKRALAAVGSP